MNSPHSILQRRPHQHPFIEVMLGLLPPGIAFMSICLGLFELTIGSGRFTETPINPSWLIEGTIMVLGQMPCLWLMWKHRHENFSGLEESLFIFYSASSAGAFFDAQTRWWLVCLRLGIAAVFAALVVRNHQYRRRQRSVDAKAEIKIFEDGSL